MPNRTLLLCAGTGLIIIGAMIWGGLFVSRGTHLELAGEVRKVRSATLGANRSVVVLDFRATNPADYPFVVKSAEVEVTLKDGTKQIGQFVPEVDAKSLFPALPSLGDKLAVSIATGERIKAKDTIERMVAATFAIAESDLDARKSLLLRLRDVDGPVSEIR